jgi:branched-chain amino acid transport system substrate-binding protein
MNNVQRILRIILSVAMVLFAFAVPQPSQAVDPYEVDVILPMTGFGGFIGQGGTQGLTAAETVINKAGGINGQPIKFVVHDDQSSPQVEVQLANAVIAQHKPFFMASSFAAQCNAIAPLVKDGPVLYCLTPSVHPEPGSHIFSIDPATADQIPVEIRYLRLHGLKRLALITSTDASGQDAEHAVDATLALPENKDVTLVAREHFATTDLTVAAQIARVRSSKADVLMAYTSGTPFGTVLRDAQSGGLNLPVMTSNANMVLAQMASYAQFLPPALYFPGIACVVPPAQIADRTLRAVVTDYDATLRAQGSAPEFMQSTTYDPALIIASALRKLGTKASADQIRSYIDGLRGFYGSAGRYDFRTFPQRGLGEPNVFIVRWESGKNAWSAVSKPGGAPL